MVVSRRRLVSALDEKFPYDTKPQQTGEVQYRTRADLPFRRVTVPGSHGGNDDLLTKTAKSIRNQLGLNSSDFARFVQCPMKADEYLRRVKKLPAAH